MEGSVLRGFPGFFWEGNDFDGTQDPFACKNVPPNTPRGRLYMVTPKPEKPWAPPGPLVGSLCIPYSAFVALARSHGVPRQHWWAQNAQPKVWHQILETNIWGSASGAQLETKG